MDLITGSLIIGTSYALLETVMAIEKALDFTSRKWNKLLDYNGLKDYKIKDKKITNTGYKIKIEIPIGGTASELEKLKEHIEKSYKCKCIIEDIQFSNYVNIELITKEIKQQEYKPIILPETTLLLGYDFRGDAITVDMLSTPHLLISGLSGQGKTGLLRTLICNLQNCDKVIINGFKDDFKDINIRHINSLEDIKDYIQDLLEAIEVGSKRSRPLYVMLEELGKVKDKELISNITKLLQYGRHNKIYVIGIIQIATKEELKFKSYFNARVSFKQLDSSSYGVALGVSVDKDLNKREFYVLSEKLQRGKTYNLEY
ncbi:MAG: FtsK/SpoIIIE domain-containing protein [Bacilli bacterium]